MLLRLKVVATSLGGLEPPTFRLTAERANRLRHRDLRRLIMTNFAHHQICLAQSLGMSRFRKVTGAGSKLNKKEQERCVVLEKI